MKDKIIGRSILSYEQVTSTNDIARRLAEGGREEGTVVQAQFQTEGRGRRGRRWHSPKNKGLLFSVILRPDEIAGQVLLINLMASVAVAQAIKNLTGAKARIKWPNDILIEGRKAGGILMESYPGFLILGIGINLTAGVDELSRGATSLKECFSPDISQDVLLKETLELLDVYYRLLREGRSEQIIEEWKTLSLSLKKQVKIVYKDRIIEGQSEDIDADGALVIRMDNGFYERILTPDVEIIKDVNSN